MTQFIREHYQVGQQRVVLVMDQNRYPLQAWAVDLNAGCLVREDDHIFTIENDSRVQFIPESDFEAFCKTRNIDTTIPDHIIQFTYALVSRTPHKISNVIPFPTKKTGTPSSLRDSSPGPLLKFAFS